MEINIKVQHLATIKEISVGHMESLCELKKRIEELYSIPASQQALMLDDRNISTSTKALRELGLRDGSTVVVKKIHRFQGQSKGTDLGSMMSNPMVKNMMKNPEMIKSIQNMFPDLKEEMKQNKTLNMMINNGGLEEEMERLSMDSNYMNAQLRNVDVTMAKLENIPGGINMMSGMMKDLEDPLRLIQVAPSFREGHKINKRMTETLPGSSQGNLLVEYRKQLSELKEIGFSDVKENIRVLSSVNGDLEAALAILVQGNDKSEDS
ncbi:hypothetical protein PAEPH01_2113 [Pancytospora epiphaga]|nr:hypothetical protein PAEPH01_2113 [Pancytospora epiphaga]